MRYQLPDDYLPANHPLRDHLLAALLGGAVVYLVLRCAAAGVW